MTRKALLTLACALSSLGCQTSKTASKVKETNLHSSPSEIKPIECAAGLEPRSWTLSALETYPSTSIIDYPAPLFGTYKWTPPNSNQNLRLDVCVGGTEASPTAELKRVIWLEGSGSIYAINNTPAAKIAGLEDALFKDKLTSLNIMFPFESMRFGADGSGFPSDGGVTIKGWSSGDQTFISATSYDSEPDMPFRPANPNLVAGKLKLGDPLLHSEGTCVGIGSESHSSFKLGTASFAVTYCNTGGTAGTNGFRLARVVITDTNASLPENLRGKEDVLMGEALEDMYGVTHHNLCDWFKFKTPGAQYAGVNMPIGVFSGFSCSSDSALPPAGKYRVKYVDHAAVTKPLGFQHFLFSNNR